MIRDQNKRHHRRGYTLIELMVSMTSATLLLAGLSSCLFIALRAFDGSSAAAVRSRAAETQAEMLVDLREATSFSNRGTDSVTFKVPDRDNDGNEETIGYSWAAGTKELSYSYNGSPSTTVLEGVTNFQLSYKSRTMPAGMSAPPPFDPNDWGTRWEQSGAGVVFEEFTEAKNSSADTHIIIPTPPGTVAGDLLIAALASDGNSTPSPDVPGDWNLITLQSAGSSVKLGVWWRTASSSEPASHRLNFSGGSGAEAYGWLMRFTGHDPANPINTWAQDFNTTITASPPSPAVTTTVADTMILRLGGFDDDDVTVDNPGLPGHTPITMDKSGNGSGTASGGAGYVMQAVAGDSGTSNFSLTGSEQWVTVTIAIAPDPN